MSAFLGNDLNAPVVLRRGAAGWACVREWSLSVLESKLGERPVSVLEFDMSRQAYQPANGEDDAAVFDALAVPTSTKRKALHDDDDDAASASSSSSKVKKVKVTHQGEEDDEVMDNAETVYKQQQQQQQEQQEQVVDNSEFPEFTGRLLPMTFKALRQLRVGGRPLYVRWSHSGVDQPIRSGFHSGAIPEELAGDVGLPVFVSQMAMVDTVVRIGLSRYCYPFHTDWATNTLVQVIGTKRVRLLHPQTPHPLPSADDTASKRWTAQTPRVPEVENADQLTDPAALVAAAHKAAATVDTSADAQARSHGCALECVLQEGDMLFLPSNWWHECASLEDGISVSVNHFFDGDLNAVADVL